MRPFVLFIAVGLLAACREPDCASDPFCAQQPPAADLQTPPPALDCPAAQPGDLVLNEILADPSGADVNGDGIPDPFQDEFVEVINRADATVDVGGTAVLVNGRLKAQLEPRCVAPGHPVVVFAGGTPTAAEAVVADSPLKLSNAGAAVSLQGPDGSVHDQWTYGKEGDGPRSLSRLPDVTGDWGEHPPLHEDAAVAHSAGRCSNGGAFPECAAVSDDPPPAKESPSPACPPLLPGELVINEILADPGSLDANQDGVTSWRDDEFVELLLLADEARDATDVALQVGDSVKTTLPAGCLPPGSGFVVFAGGTPALHLGPLVRPLVSEKRLGLRNAGDTVTLRRQDLVIDRVSYGEEGGHDQSLTRFPDGVGTMVQHTTVSAGAAASPGACVAGDDLSASCPPPDPLAGP